MNVNKIQIKNNCAIIYSIGGGVTATSWRRSYCHILAEGLLPHPDGGVTATSWRRSYCHILTVASAPAVKRWGLCGCQATCRTHRPSKRSWLRSSFTGTRSGSFTQSLQTIKRLFTFSVALCKVCTVCSVLGHGKLRSPRK